MALEDTAQQLIAKFGRIVTLRRLPQTVPSGAPWDANTGTTVDTAVSAVLLDVEASQVDGTTIMAADKRAYIAALDAADINTGDRLVDGAVVWQVMRAAQLKPGNTAYLWTLQLRA